MNRKQWMIVSGGQTGVDRAALVAAMTFSIPFGGWVPKGRFAEDGMVPAGFYSLKELPEGGYRARTRANVRDSDATLILVDALPLTGGTAFTVELAESLGKPYKVVNLDAVGAQREIYDWMMSLEERPEVGDTIKMNVAGPRESKVPGIFEKAKGMLIKILWGFRNFSGGDIVRVDNDGELVAWIDAEFAEEIFDVRKNQEAARGEASAAENEPEVSA